MIKAMSCLNSSPVEIFALALYRRVFEQVPLSECAYSLEMDSSDFLIFSLTFSAVSC